MIAVQTARGLRKSLPPLLRPSAVVVLDDSRRQWRVGCPSLLYYRPLTGSTTPSSSSPSSSTSSSTSTVNSKSIPDQKTDPTTTTTTTTTANQPPPPPPPRPVSQYYVPKSERGVNRSGFDMDHNVLVGETRLARNSRTCPTRELYFLNTQWQIHKSPYRKFRHMANVFRSAPFQRLLFPDLFCVTAVAGCLTYYNEVVVAMMMTLEEAGGGGVGMVSTLSMSSTAFAGATTAIGLLAGFRLNASYGRYVDGRKQWSDVNTITRDIARQTKMWMVSSSSKNDNEATGATRMLRLCQAFPITLLFHLNDKGCHHNMKRKSKPGEAPFEERVQAEFQAELYDVYYPTTKNNNNSSSITNTCQTTTSTNTNTTTATHLLLQQDMERLCRVKKNRGNVPLEVLTCMGETLANTATMNPIFVRELDVQISRLVAALGSSERIVKTPLPTGFTRHSSRLLFIWSNCLPFALYPLLGPWGTLPTTVLTTYAVLGIEDISVQLEEPFDILPLRQFSDSMYDGIQMIDQNFVVSPPPPLTGMATSAAATTAFSSKVM
jgi:ion channel-forming bestrophin family protein